MGVDVRPVVLSHNVSRPDAKGHPEALAQAFVEHRLGQSSSSDRQDSLMTHLVPSTISSYSTRS